MCSAFLDLPAEPRNQIYEYAALNEGVLRIKKKHALNSRRRIASESGLILANHQVRTEYTEIVQDVALRASIPLRVSIIDFNFRPLQRFISSTSLPINEWEESRISIELIIYLAESAAGHATFSQDLSVSSDRIHTGFQT